jgi:hypothetical protein
MRILLPVLFLLSLAPRLDACSCAGPGTPCSAAGISAAVFTGTVIDISWVPAQFPPPPTSTPTAGQRGRASRSPGERDIRPGFRVARLQVKDELSGVDGQKEIEVASGLGDCAYTFEPGQTYVVYAHKNAEGRLETSSCARTRRLEQAAEDLAYFRAMAGAPATSEILVRTSYPGVSAKAGVSIVAESQESRHTAQTDSAGNVRFAGLPPGEYRIHAETDGDLPDDPKVQLYAKGCQDVTLFRTLRIIGHLLTRDGQPAARVGVQVRSTAGIYVDSRMTDADGGFELRIIRPGQYYLGINLNHTAMRDTPYPRWFYPGTEIQASASVIDFSGKPDTGVYNFTLPKQQAERIIDGIVLTADGHPMSRAVVSVYDSFEAVVAGEIADNNGRFLLRVFADIPYRVHAVWPGDTQGSAVSAVPTDIQPGNGQLSLRLILTQPGNSYFEAVRKGPGDNGTSKQ